MSTDLTLHARLREATAALHRQVEAQLDLLGPALTVARYRAALQTFHGFHLPLEPRIAACAPAPPFPLRDRAARLRRDLLALGASDDEIARLPVARDLPPLGAPAHLAGCLYVLEGASLGGVVVARQVRARLGITDGLSFFAGDGADTGARWRRVLAWLEDLVAAGVSGAAIIAAARATFGSFLAWAQAREAAP